MAPLSSLSTRRGASNKKASSGITCVRCLRKCRYLSFLAIAVLIALNLSRSLQSEYDDDYPYAYFYDMAQNASSHGGRGLRTRAHVCYSSVHAEVPTRILTEDLHFQLVDATKGEGWDVMYGGYPHCARSKSASRGNFLRWDWEFEGGLNKAMVDKGFENLKPHQVYHPCMGCKFSYCNKRDMCRLVRDHIDRDVCYILPEDLERLKSAMRDKRHQAWVMKEDAINVHLHTGVGVQFLSGPDQLPSSAAMARGVYMVQPWVEPYLGEGMFRRKAELRFQTAITEVYPLRAYIHSDPYVIMAGTEYTTTPEAVNDKCMRDTHSSTKRCDYSDEFAKKIKPFELIPRDVRFEDWADFVGLEEAKRKRLFRDAHELIAKVYRAGHYAMEQHPINEGINASGAMCFSHMRVDVGIRSDLTPVIYEMPEFHGLYGSLTAGGVTIRDLFLMIGLDAPPVPKQKRADYELNHLGTWLPLPVPN